MADAPKVDLNAYIRSEFKKSSVDPVYFIKRYCHIQEPVKGRSLFDLWDYQVKSIGKFQAHDFNIVLKGRQIGISTVVACYALWLMTFHKDKNILVIATKQDTAKNLIMKVRFAYDHLPVWLQIPCIENNKLAQRFNNGSQIKAATAAGDSGRSEALSLLILDEAAFIRNAKDIWTAALPTLSTGGKGILISTPNGMGNFFHQTWVKATSGEKSFILDAEGRAIPDPTDVDINPIKLDWSVHPNRDAAWRAKMGKLQGEREARQEFDADFIGTGNTVIDAEKIEEYAKKTEEPKFKAGFDGNLWIWEPPDFRKQYMVVADVARGDGMDKSAFHVLDIGEAKQVAEYKGVIGTNDYGDMLRQIARQYNEALLVVENANVGWAVIQRIIDKGYANLFYMSKDLRVLETERHTTNRYYAEEKKMVPGFTTSVKTRPLIISKLNTYMLDDSVIIRSMRTIEELRVFIWDGSKSQAMEGYNDDLVMSLCIGLWVRDVALKLYQQGNESVKTAIEKIQRASYDGIYTTVNRPPDPYIMPSRNPNADQDDMDIRWLLG